MRNVLVKDQKELSREKEILLSQGYVMTQGGDEYTVFEKQPEKADTTILIVALLVCIPAFIYLLIRDAGRKADKVTVRISA